MSYIESNKIKVFPAAFRSYLYADSKKTNEENLLKFNRLSSNKVNLNQLFRDPDNQDYIIFNIHGYWFRCLEVDIPLVNSLKAYIKLKYEDGIGFKLDSTGIDGSCLDDEDYFKGLTFTTEPIPQSEDPTSIQYYGIQVRDGNGNLIYQNLKLDANEIRNDENDLNNKSISEEFTTDQIKTDRIVSKTVDGSIVITSPDINGGTADSLTSLSIVDAGTTKNLKIVSDSTAAFTVDHTLTLDLDNADKTLKLTGSPTLSGIITTGAGTLALNKNLTISTGNITLTGKATGSSVVLPESGTIYGTKTDSITSLELATSVSDETGTGSLVFANTPTLTTPKINDTSSNHTYTIAASELAANRTVTLPLLTGNDEFVFKAHPQTLSNKTLLATTINESASSANSDSYELTFKGRNASGTQVSGALKLDGPTSRLQFGGITIPTISSPDTLSNKTLASPTINTSLLAGSSTMNVFNNRAAITIGIGDAAGVVTINGTTDSSTKDNGALVVKGGVGVEKYITTGSGIILSDRVSTIVTNAGALTRASASDLSVYSDLLYGDGTKAVPVIPFKLLHRSLTGKYVLGSFFNLKLAYDSDVPTFRRKNYLIVPRMSASAGAKTGFNVILMFVNSDGSYTSANDDNDYSIGTLAINGPALLSLHSAGINENAGDIQSFSVCVNGQFITANNYYSPAEGYIGIFVSHSSSFNSTPCPFSIYETF